MSQSARFPLYFPIWGRNERLLSFYISERFQKAARRRKSAHPGTFVLHTAYDEQAQLCCYALSLPTAEIDWTSHTLPLRDLENDQLITIDLNTGIAL